MTDRTPAQIEAEGGEVEIEWLGHTITLPADPQDWDINVTRAYHAQDLIGALEGLVGPSKFQEIEKAHRKAHGGKFLNRDLDPLGKKMAELYGFETQGN